MTYHDNRKREHIYDLTVRINDCLRFEFGIKGMYHRMIFTACALVAKRYDAPLTEGMNYSEFVQAIKSSLYGILTDGGDKSIELLLDVFSEIHVNFNVDENDKKGMARTCEIIGRFIGWVTEISDCLNSDAWRGEDVMGTLFNEFNMYRKKSEAGQVFTPEHITDFMYRILEVNKNDRVLDACCGSGGFLVKAMSNMIQDAGGVQTEKAKEIKTSQLYGIEFDREVYALACANMLAHKDSNMNLMQMDARSEVAGEWIAEQRITKVLMNPPYENKYGCMKIVENVLDNVTVGTLCGFILPDKKLEKASKAQIGRILKHHRIRKIVKMPEDLFFGIGVTTSIFVFESGVPQNGMDIFACWMKDDGLQTVKNKGRHDIHGRWPDIENDWVDIVHNQNGDETCQWIKPSEHLSYQKPQKPFQIFEEDFRKTVMDYLLFENDIDVKDLTKKLVDEILYGRPPEMRF